MTSWDEIRFPAEDDRLWELYHENSKLSAVSLKAIPTEYVRERFEKMHVSLPVQSEMIRAIDAIKEHSHEIFQQPFNLQNKDAAPAGSISFDILSQILHASSTIMFDTDFGLHVSPLEVYGLLAGIEGLPNGLYHYDSDKQILQLMRGEIPVSQLTDSLPGYNLTKNYLFITALFMRTAIPFGERGYRIALTLSGQAMQNIILCCAMHTFIARPVISADERKVEEILSIDGVDHALLQVIEI